MKPILQIENDENLSLRDIDERMEELVRCGYGGAVISALGGWEAVLGWCRSAYRHKAKLWLWDDCAPLSGGGNSAVTSVSEFRPLCLAPLDAKESEKENRLLWRQGDMAVAVRSGNSLWGADPFNPYSVDAFIDGFYRELKREASRFIGHEIVGVVSRFSVADEPLPYSQYLSSYILERYKINIEENAGSLFYDVGDFQNIRRIYSEAADALFTQVCLKRLGDFCRENNLLLAGLSNRHVSQSEKYISVEAANSPRTEAKMIFSDMSAMSFAQRQREINRAFVNSAQIIAPKLSLSPQPAEEAWAAAAERLFVLSEGRELKRAETDGLSPEITVCRAEGKNGEMLFLANMGDKRELAEINTGARSGYVIDTLSGKTYFMGNREKIRLNLEPSGSFALMLGGGDSFAEPAPPFTKSGAVFACFFKDAELSLEQVQTEEILDGALRYAAVLPEGCGGKYLALEGSFNFAFVKIGRRICRLIAAPFMLELFSSDEGRQVEILIFPTPEHNSESFGINNANIVRAENLL